MESPILVQHLPPTGNPVRLTGASLRQRPKKGGDKKWPIKKALGMIPKALIRISRLLKRPELMESFWHKRSLKSTRPNIRYFTRQPSKRTFGALIRGGLERY